MSLAGGAKHGHALLKDIEDFAGVKLGPGALYGAITRMEERGLIAPLRSNDRRRPYQITATGSAALADSVDKMRELARVGETRLKIVRTAGGSRDANRRTKCERQSQGSENCE